MLKVIINHFMELRKVKCHDYLVLDVIACLVQIDRVSVLRELLHDAKRHFLHIHATYQWLFVWHHTSIQS